jgi:solute carrier family 25 phosphate transporter 23/24/25/41
VSKTVTAPLARLTILYQVQTTNHVPGWTAGRSLSIGEALTRVARTEGVLVRLSQSTSAT